MTKRTYSEKAFREYLDNIYPRGIEIHESFYRSAKELQTKSNATFRTMYNDWLDYLEKDGIETGIYPESYYKERRN